MKQMKLEEELRRNKKDVMRKKDSGDLKKTDVGRKKT